MRNGGAACGKEEQGKGHGHSDVWIKPGNRDIRDTNRMHQVSNNIMQLADNNRNLKVKVVKKEDRPDRFIESHELSLLSLLVQKHPDRAREFLARLRESLPKAA
jgi:hypothetical protein